MTVDLWSFIALQMLAIGSGVVTAGLIVLLGGMGGLGTLARRQIITEQRVEDVDARITSEVKKRAGEASQKGRTKAKAAQDEVDEALGHGKDEEGILPFSKARKRPSVVTPIDKRS